MTRITDSDVRARLSAAAERRLSVAEVEAYVRTPISDAEREEVRAQIRWFRRRYPTGADRLAYVRQAYRRWTRFAVTGTE
jgi:hypothetical protein